MRVDVLLLTGLLITVGYVQTTSAMDSAIVCSGQDVPFVPLKLEPEAIVRKDVPATIFGFDLPWFDFQLGHFRNGQIRSETINWLKPFAGAIYRFPGGNTYSWQKTVQPRGGRGKVVAAYTRTGFEIPAFGPTEFVQFLNQVDGKAIMMLNLVGPDGKLIPAEQMLKDNIGLVNWFKNQSALKCVSGKNCRIQYWEMGNELDWPNTNWSAHQYILRSEPLVDSLKKADPEIKLLALGKTAPWDSPKVADDFNSQVAGALAVKVSGVTLHPYYDGHAIPIMTSWINKTVTPYLANNPDAKMVITEHGRWPNQKSQHWEDDWYKASGTGGAISSADFIISIMGMPEVAAASWHALGVKGPWQLFHLDKNRDEIYPSAVYWGLRVLREAFLQDLIQITPDKVMGFDYAGGYGMKFVAMKDASGRISIIGVNRKKVPVQLSFEMDPSWRGKSSDVAKVNYLSADERGSDNDDKNKNKFVMRSQSIQTAKHFIPGLCVPPRTVFSLVQ